MNGTNQSSCAKNERGETVSRFLSSMGCSWNTNETDSSDEKSATSSTTIERATARHVSYPSFSLTDNIHEEQEDEEEKDYDSDSSSHRRKAVQSKASKLMSRKGVLSPLGAGDQEQQSQSQSPQRVMLENILDSFDQLVDARIRAYACILSNHVQVLSESNNTKGARIAEYKLQTLLDVAANHLLFDSISTEFRTSTSNKECDVYGNDSISSVTSDSTATKEERSFSVPIELAVEIQSPRFFHEGLEAIGCSDVSSPVQRGHQGKLIFSANGKLRGDRFLIGPNSNTSNDTDRCLMPGCRNSKDGSRIQDISIFENIEIEIDCDTLLSQMMEEASKVVTMAVELTNLAWANNTEKQKEINKMNMVANNTRKTANIIVDDEDSSTAGEHLPARMIGKRSRSEDNTGSHTGTTMSKQVSEISLRPPAQVECDEEHIEDSQVSNDAPSSTATAKITNLHMLDQDVERKTRYFDVSDPSYDSSSTGTDHDYRPEKCPPEDKDDEDESYSKITAERACHIVDFVLAGDVIPCHLPPNKKLRTK
jgi:hypothetical protein